MNWILIVFVNYFGYGYGTTEQARVPGFHSKEECVEFGEKLKASNKKVGFVCVGETKHAGKYIY